MKNLFQTKLVYTIVMLLSTGLNEAVTTHEDA
ncbi:MAG: hypothetical protein ACI8ZM_001610 [Crocinitomix sp.]|jgi:hypothetical protein